MNIQYSISRKTCVATLTLIFAWQGLYEVASAQMEKRKDEHYHLAQFIAAYPKIGVSAPELELVTLDGEKAKLSDFRGKQVVLIKAGYT